MIVGNRRHLCWLSPQHLVILSTKPSLIPVSWWDLKVTVSYLLMCLIYGAKVVAVVNISPPKDRILNLDTGSLIIRED